MRRRVSGLFVWVFFLVLSLAACGTKQLDSDTSSDQPPLPLVLMTDFSLKDGAVSAMKGVAFDVSPRLTVSDLTHEIPPFNIWEGSYRLSQTYKYWPAGTVFVTVVDPGVGSDRRSIVARSKSGHYFVGPDNGLYTLIDDESGLEAVRVIDESRHRLKGSSESYTFHGRDLYVHVGARLASRQIGFVEIGEPLGRPIVKIPYQKAEHTNGKIRGIIPILDPNYGNVWTNIPKSLVSEKFPQRMTFEVRVYKGKRQVYRGKLPLVDTFAGVPQGQPLLYFNSLLNLSLALNMADFAKRHGIGSGPEWTISVE
jgi:S-adenosylmethionine hydrolase